MTDHQILAVWCGSAVLAIIILMARIQVVKLRDDLSMARHTINELAPKAQAWDAYLGGRREAAALFHNRPKGADAEAANQRTREAFAPFGVNYQHLSAECDGCDDTPRLQEPRWSDEWRR